MEVDDEWLTEMERLEKHQKAVARVQGRLPPAAPLAQGTAAEPGPAPVTTPLAQAPVTVPALPQQREQPLPVPEPAVAVPLPKKRKAKPKVLFDSEIKESNILPAGSTRTRRPVLQGLFCSALMAVSNTPILQMAQRCIGSPAAYAAMTGFDAVTETFDCVDFHSFKAMTTPVRTKMKIGQDPDCPTFE